MPLYRKEVISRERSENGLITCIDRLISRIILQCKYHFSEWKANRLPLFQQYPKTKTPSRNRRDHLYGWVSKYRK